MTSQTYLILLVGLVLLFYLMILRPQRRAKAQREQMLSALVPGTRVITAGGIHGTILEVDEGVLDLEVAEGVVLQVDPRAVAEVVPEDEDDEDEDDEDDEDDDDEGDEDGDDHGDEVDEVDEDAGGEQDAPGVEEPRP